MQCAVGDYRVAGSVYVYNNPNSNLNPNHNPNSNPNHNHNPNSNPNSNPTPTPNPNPIAAVPAVPSSGAQPFSLLGGPASLALSLLLSPPPRADLAASLWSMNYNFLALTLTLILTLTLTLALTRPYYVHI